MKTLLSKQRPTDRSYVHLSFPCGLYIKAAEDNGVLNWKERLTKDQACALHNGLVYWEFYAWMPKRKPTTRKATY